MSPRLVTDDTRPRWLASIVRTNAALSQTDAAPAVKPSRVIASTRTGREPIPTAAIARPWTTSSRKAAAAPYVGCQRMPTTLPTIAPAARQASAMPSQWAPQPEPLTRSATPESGDRRDEDVQRGQAHHEELRRVVAAEVLEPVGERVAPPVLGGPGQAVARSHDEGEHGGDHHEGRGIDQHHRHQTAPGHQDAADRRAEQLHRAAADLVPALDGAEVVARHDLAHQGQARGHRQAAGDPEGDRDREQDRGAADPRGPARGAEDQHRRLAELAGDEHAVAGRSGRRGHRRAAPAGPGAASRRRGRRRPAPARGCGPRSRRGRRSRRSRRTRTGRPRTARPAPSGPGGPAAERRRAARAGSWWRSRPHRSAREGAQHHPDGQSLGRRAGGPGRPGTRCDQSSVTWRSRSVSSSSCPRVAGTMVSVELAARRQSTLTSCTWPSQWATARTWCRKFSASAASATRRAALPASKSSALQVSGRRTERHQLSRVSWARSGAGSMKPWRCRALRWWLTEPTARPVRVGEPADTRRALDLEQLGQPAPGRVVEGHQDVQQVVALVGSAARRRGRSPGGAGRRYVGSRPQPERRPPAVVQGSCMTRSEGQVRAARRPTAAAARARGRDRQHPDEHQRRQQPQRAGRLASVVAQGGEHPPSVRRRPGARSRLLR